MRMLVGWVVLLMLVGACGESDPWRDEAAAAIGAQLADRLADPLAQAADTAEHTDLDPVMTALEAAFDDMTLPADVYRIVPGSHSSSTSGSDYADVSLPLVVVPIDRGSMFCMIFALSSTGELVAEPALGDPVNRCADTESVRLTQP